PEWPAADHAAPAARAAASSRRGIDIAARCQHAYVPCTDAAGRRRYDPAQRRPASAVTGRSRLDMDGRTATLAVADLTSCRALARLTPADAERAFVTALTAASATIVQV